MKIIVAFRGERRRVVVMEANMNFPDPSDLEASYYEEMQDAERAEWAGICEFCEGEADADGECLAGCNDPHERDDAEEVTNG